jgi:hypothetical protein
MFVPHGKHMSRGKFYFTVSKHVCTHKCMPWEVRGAQISACAQRFMSTPASESQTEACEVTGWSQSEQQAHKALRLPLWPTARRHGRCCQRQTKTDVDPYKHEELNRRGIYKVTGGATIDSVFANKSVWMLTCKTCRSIDTIHIVTSC